MTEGTRLGQIRYGALKNYEDDDVTEDRRSRERDYADYGTKEELDRDHDIEARLDKSDVPEDTIMNPGNVDESKWSKAKELAAKSGGGHHRWALVSYLYQKLGGEFHRKT